MIELEKEFNTTHFKYVQISRDSEDYCIYAQISKSTDKIISYEVFKTEIQPSREMHGNIIPEQWFFPGKSVFGKKAWCVISLERAYEKIKELKEKRIQLDNPVEKPEIIKKEPSFWPSGKPKGRPRKIVE